MAVIPASVVESNFSPRLIALGYELIYRGKVGELYRAPGKDGQLLMVRSDRLSIFDFVLPCTVDFKGEVLIALTHFWLNLFPDVPNHLLAWGTDEERWAAAGWKMEDVMELPLERILLVKADDVWPYEMIYRHHIGGSVWKQYLSDGTACGNKLPPGLTKWQKLESPIFTPTTKEESGHDVAVDIAKYDEEGGDFGMMLSQVCGDFYARAYEYAANRGILILDTKFEISPDGILLDEVLTPDSSRFTTVASLEAAISAGTDPAFYDKEPVRIWGRQLETPWGIGLHELDPENDEHLDFVASLDVPGNVIAQCSQRYLELPEMLTGKSLGMYQQHDLLVP
jgi:phosphoribosylaminoimidazole-succinocarboxamide synthase